MKAFAAVRGDGRVVTWGDGPSGGDSSPSTAKIDKNLSTSAFGRPQGQPKQHRNAYATYGHHPESCLKRREPMENH